MIGIGLASLLVSTGFAGSSDPNIERLERLERALQIEDCAYAVKELEHLNLSFNNVPFRYALLAEGYLCVGKPDKARLAVSEFDRLGGAANQLSMRVQEYCALQECAVEPVLVKPVVHHLVEEKSKKSGVLDTVLEPKIEPVMSNLSSSSTDDVEGLNPATATSDAMMSDAMTSEILTSKTAVDDLASTQIEDGAPQESMFTSEETKDIEDVRIEPSVVSLNEGSTRDISAPENVVQDHRMSSNQSVTGDQQDSSVLVDVVSESEPSGSLTSSLVYSVEDINGMVVDGQCGDAAAAGANLIVTEPENALAYMAFGDALACYPEGSGDVFAAFDAWIIAKSLAKTQQLDWLPMKERLGWALQRSGIVKIIPEFEEGYTDWPDGFSIVLESNRSVDLTPRTDHMLGGIYLTNLPEGQTRIRITLGGARPEVVRDVVVKAGELQKISIPIGAEKHIRLPSFLTPEGYGVSFTSNSDNAKSIVYDPSVAMLLPKDTYSVDVTYGARGSVAPSEEGGAGDQLVDQSEGQSEGQSYTFQMNVDGLVAEAQEAKVDITQSIRKLLPWVYQVRNTDGILLTDGLVYPDQDSQDVLIPLETVSYTHWRDGTAVDDDTAISLVASGTIEALEQSLFTEVVVEPSLHPFYDTVTSLYDMEVEVASTEVSNQWLTGTMLIGAVWTGGSLFMANQSDTESQMWESQAMVGSMLTVPMVAIWMVEKMYVHPKKQRSIENLHRLLESMDNHPIPITDLQPE